MRKGLASLGAVPSEERTLADMVTARIRDAITQGELAPGQCLTEAELASRLGVSRSPVREALARLRSEGLVVGPSASYVWQPSRAEVDEVFSLRAALDSMAIERLVSENRLVEVDFAKLQSLIDEWQQAVGDQKSLSSTSIVAADEAFYGHLHRRSGRALVMRVWRQTISQWRYLMHHYLRHYDPLEIAQGVASSHEVVLDGLRRGDLTGIKAELEAISDQRSKQIKGVL